MILQCSPRERPAEPSTAQQRRIYPPPQHTHACSDAPKWLLHPLSIHSAQKSTIKQINLQTSFPNSDPHVHERSLFIYQGLHLPGCISEVLRCFILSVFSETLLRTVCQSSPQVEFHFFFIPRGHDYVCQTTKNINNTAIMKSILLPLNFTAPPPL